MCQGEGTVATVDLTRQSANSVPSAEEESLQLNCLVLIGFSPFLSLSTPWEGAFSFGSNMKYLFTMNFFQTLLVAVT